MSERYVFDGKPLYTQEEYEHFQTAYREAVIALEVANDCLFGNTHDDKHLNEAYRTVHDFLAKHKGRPPVPEPQVQVVTSRYMRKKNTQLRHENRRLETECAELRAAIERGVIGQTDGVVDTRRAIIPIAEYNALLRLADAAEAVVMREFKKSVWSREMAALHNAMEAIDKCESR